MAIQNGSFEDADVQPGQALNWSVSTIATAEELVEFDVITPQSFEDFEEEWNNDTWIEEASSMGLVVALFDAGTPETTEDFEEEWDNDTWTSDPSEMVIVVKMFDIGTPESVEDFEEEWKSNEGYVWTWSGGVGAALFNFTSDIVGQTSETFEDEVTFDTKLVTDGIGDPEPIDESHFVNVEIAISLVAEVQVQAKFQGTWQDVGSPISNPGDTIIIPDDRSEIRVYTISYTSGSIVAKYTWGEVAIL